MVLLERAGTLDRLVPGSVAAQAPSDLGALQSGFRLPLRGKSRIHPLVREAVRMGSVVKKRRKRMAKKKHRKLLRKTRVQRRRLGK
ncbi:hypothetical protein GCM10009828_026420 [Actinoplanes couchii]|uniref:Ribosomal protein mS38 C-terminal domain-containing protein n=1 Tax=Actinoplanes couchii TaxID=403638 RepID=A0ABQ3XA35_9ACTN|nr:hypothetical protein Aco03nite_037800 [Actinoplanes couchii]